MRISRWACVVALCFVGTAGPGWAAGAISIESPWARPALGAMKTSAAYFTIKNGGAASETLTGVDTSAASMAQLHESKMIGQMMTMEPLPEIEIPAGGAVALKPGGKHVMLMGLNAPLKIGDTLTLILHFKQAGDVAVAVPVTAPPSSSH